MTFSKLKSAIAVTTVTSALALSNANQLHADTQSMQIDLTYVWTAHPGMEKRLVATYGAVGEVLQANEPGLLTYEIAVSETGNQIVIHEVFKDGEALAFHLSETAAQFFPQLVEFATPGPFIFRGDVPEDLKAAAYQMNMGAIFTADWSGFERN
ncbi:antibiotic biosynthesis monooxygenase [Alisedimentitalea sp. MJ-SS2]|uniref:putative quinol monooxygenase n=1 Tax=Aliisedimentitalea sp. MJ-SS2 TaxID=3049795 RepID=UPI00290B59FE|nr:antibiotic biosynthesis monooxygenase [Alisedimentitalea sp. MJ-SS2]MDU8927181.1 antibiotic biosynthesis monooxygenase [Alisedimentitalea sp. MJ-SS2]